MFLPITGEWTAEIELRPGSRRSDRLPGPPIDFPAQRLYFALHHDQSAERASTYYRGALRAPFVGSSVPVWGTSVSRLVVSMISMVSAYRGIASGLGLRLRLSIGRRD
jgi:hypothetical protein